MYLKSNILQLHISTLITFLIIWGSEDHRFYWKVMQEIKSIVIQQYSRGELLKG